MRRGSQVAPRSLVASPTRLSKMSCQKICILIKLSLQSKTHQSKPACKKRRKKNLELKPHITVCVSAQVVLFFFTKVLEKEQCSWRYCDCFTCFRMFVSNGVSSLRFRHSKVPELVSTHGKCEST